MAGVVFTSNAGALAARLRRKASSFIPLQVGAMRAATNDVLHEARRLSGRTYATTAKLRAMGHPYARAGRGGGFGRRLRGGAGLPAPPFVLNLQTGRLHGLWRTLVRRGMGVVTGTVYNLAAYSRFMRGTRKMIERPILQEALRRHKQRMLRRFRGGLQKSLSSR